MKLWKIFLVFVAIISILNIAQVEADNITGSMGNTSSMLVGSTAGSIYFVGYASPLAMVFFMENGQVIGTGTADINSAFDKTLSGLASGIHDIGVYAQDADNVNTSMVNYSVNVVENTSTSVSVILPPSFVVASDTVKRSAPLNGHGRGYQLSTVQIFISGSLDSQSITTQVDANGRWSINLNPKLHLGLKTAYGIILDGQGGQSEVSESHNYTVTRTADLNNDNTVDLTDFSILMYSYSSLPIKNVISDINDNGVVDLVDFSIMMANWSH